jgi:hypothetical protein
MKSQLADQARRALLEDVRRMSGEQRLIAYHEHCKLMAELQQAGEDARRAIGAAGLDAELRVVGREDFIAMKACAGGPQDLADASAAIALDPESLDLALLRRLAARFGRDTPGNLERLPAATD